MTKRLSQLTVAEFEGILRSLSGSSLRLADVSLGKVYELWRIAHKLGIPVDAASRDSKVKLNQDMTPLEEPATSVFPEDVVGVAVSTDPGIPLNPLARAQRKVVPMVPAIAMDAWVPPTLEFPPVPGKTTPAWKPEGLHPTTDSPMPEKPIVTNAGESDDPTTS